MIATKHQGLLFAIGAFLLSGYHAGTGLPAGIKDPFVLALLIVLLGVPHGALDTLYAGRVFRIRRASQWLLFLLIYLLPVAAVLLLWPYWPAFLLALFLTVSIFHFSGDPEEGCPRWLRMVYGGSPVVLPSLLNGAEVDRLFAALVPGSVASSVTAILTLLAWPWLLALALGAAKLARSHRRGAIEIAAVGTLCSLVPPLLSFTIYFCGMHSARHILRSLTEDATQPARWPDIGRAALAGVPPMLATLVILALYWGSAGNTAVEPRLLQTVFVSLAALTFPHVILVDWLHRWRFQHPAGANAPDFRSPVRCS
jgi:Brp/Blh family beta-carotene 15,15'-monooxygenase